MVSAMEGNDATTPTTPSPSILPSIEPALESASEPSVSASASASVSPAPSPELVAPASAIETPTPIRTTTEPSSAPAAPIIRYRNDSSPLVRRIFSLSCGRCHSSTTDARDEKDGSINIHEDGASALSSLDDSLLEWKETTTTTQTTSTEAGFNGHAPSPNLLRDASGLSPLHWAAGSLSSPHDASVLRHLLDFLSPCHHFGAGSRKTLGRTPAHYAARNGRVEALEILRDWAGDRPSSGVGTNLVPPYETVSRSVDAEERGSGVTPLQMAVWQNRTPAVRFLVERCGIDPRAQTNAFGCGLVHWIGISPADRADLPPPPPHADDDGGSTPTVHRKELRIPARTYGAALIPLAAYLLRTCRLDFRSTQNQGHSPFHKAAWSGNLALLLWLNATLDVWDTHVDDGGNLAYDMVVMQSHKKEDGRYRATRDWLRWEGSGIRKECHKVLGVPLGLDTASGGEGAVGRVRGAYLAKMRGCHPDRYPGRRAEFDKLKEAFECWKTRGWSVVEEGGGGGGDDDGGGGGGGGAVEVSFGNPRHTIPLLLTDGSATSVRDDGDDGRRTSRTAASIDGDGDDASSLFKTRILSVLAHYGTKGIDLSNVPRKWNQVWPDIEFYGPVPRKEGGGTGNRTGRDHESSSSSGGRKGKKGKKGKKGLPKGCRKGQLAQYIVAMAGDVLEIVPVYHTEIPRASGTEDDGSSHTATATGRQSDDPEPSKPRKNDPHRGNKRFIVRPRQ